MRDNENVTELLNKRIAAKAECLVDRYLLFYLGIKGCYVAGSSLNEGPVNDVDMFPLKHGGWPWSNETKEKWEFFEEKLGAIPVGYGRYRLANVSVNAVTVARDDGMLYQFCNYTDTTLYNLIYSFDFAHVQVGAEIIMNESMTDRNGFPKPECLRAHYTSAWVNSRTLRDTWYTGSEFPLGSLIRLPKYVKRGIFRDIASYRVAVISILNDIIKRGYVDYEDYKKQLASIDLRVEKDSGEEAYALFQTLLERGLVDNEHIVPEQD